MARKKKSASPRAKTTKSKQSGRKPKTTTESPSPSSKSEADTQPFPSAKMTQKELIAATGLSRSQLISTGIDWRELAAIYEDHAASREELEDTAQFVSAKLRRLSSVHSVRSRIKNPAHLIRKVVRKRKSDPERAIGFHNYTQEITDLVGIRALHLVKDEWWPIHEFVAKEWKLLETPLAYHRDGDHPDWLAAFQAAGCSVMEHPRKYRSVHYLLSSAGSKASTVVELQVRTLFEEAWSEIDHRINYPESVDFGPVGFFLEIFNRLAGSADEMGSFILTLMAELSELSRRADGAEAARKEASAKADELIKKLKISGSERKALREELDSLRESAVGHWTTPTSGITITSKPSSGITITPKPSASILVGDWQNEPSGAIYGSNIFTDMLCSACGHSWQSNPSVFSIPPKCPKCEAVQY